MEPPLRLSERYRPFETRVLPSAVPVTVEVAPDVVVTDQVALDLSMVHTRLGTIVTEVEGGILLCAL